MYTLQIAERSDEKSCVHIVGMNLPHVFAILLEMDCLWKGNEGLESFVIGFVTDT